MNAGNEGKKKDLEKKRKKENWIKKVVGKRRKEKRNSGRERKMKRIGKEKKDEKE